MVSYSIQVVIILFTIIIRLGGIYPMLIDTRNITETLQTASDDTVGDISKRLIDQNREAYEKLAK